jgi:hypothetical protein
MTDARDACAHCDGHRRRNVWSGLLCPDCEQRHQRGEITQLGDRAMPSARVLAVPAEPPAASSALRASPAIARKRA